LRCDANVSLRIAGSDVLGTKVEIKNLNSFRHVQHALEYEVKRQAQALDVGERLTQEARRWDPERARTVATRSKEFAHDYRYFPEPDLPPLDLAATEVERLRGDLPELPPAKRVRFVQVYRLSPHAAEPLHPFRLAGLLALIDDGTISGKIAKDVFEKMLRSGEDARAIVGREGLTQ